MAEDERFSKLKLLSIADQFMIAKHVAFLFSFNNNAHVLDVLGKKGKFKHLSDGDLTLYLEKQKYFPKTTNTSVTKKCL